MMRIILLMGTSSVGKSTLCRELKKTYDFHVVKNGDEYFDDHLKDVKKILSEMGIIEKLSPMRPDEVLRFCMTNQLNIASIAIKDHKLNGITDLPDALKEKAGFDIVKFYENLNEAKKIFRAIKGPSYEESLQKSFDEALDPAKRDKTIVIDLVPEPTPEKTEAVIDDFKKMATTFSKDNNIPVTVSTVLIYCSLEKLSENMERRNREAEKNENIVDKRVGTLPLQVMTSLATAELDIHEDKQRELMTVSTDQLRAFMDKHSAPDAAKSDYALITGQGSEYVYGFRLPPDKTEVVLTVPKALQFDYLAKNDGVISVLAKDLVDTLQLQAGQDESHVQGSTSSINLKLDVRPQKIVDVLPEAAKKSSDPISTVSSDPHKESVEKESSDANIFNPNPFKTTPKPPGGSD